MTGGRLRLVCVVYFFAAVGCATAPVPVDAPQWIAASEQFARIVRDLTNPSMEGRGAGTAGIDRARDYLVEQFEALGLRPAFGQVPDRVFTQHFEVDLVVEVRHQMLHIAADAREAAGLELQSGEDFSALGLSANGSFDGPAVFVGYGIDRSDRGYNSFVNLEPDRLAGKVAVAFRFEPMDDERRSLWVGGRTQEAGPWSDAASFSRKAEEAARRGATALLVVNPSSHDAGSMLRTPNQSTGSRAPIPVLQIHSRVFDRMLGPQRDKSRRLAARLQLRANAGETVVLELGSVRGRVELDHPRATVANVAAVLPGTGPLADEVIVVAAHYDHLGHGEVGSRGRERADYPMGRDPAFVYPGADDNASGTAGLLLLTQSMARRYKEDRNGPRRTVVFVAFAGEERGLLGSSHFVGHLDDLGIATGQITAMINMDMIGRLDKNRLYVFGTGSGESWKQLVRHANRDTNLRLSFQGVSVGASDHVSFIARGVPALHFFTGVHGDYHRPTDTPDKINAVDAARVLRLIDALLATLSARPQRIGLVEEESMSRPGAASRGDLDGAQLGVLPDFATLYGDTGCGVQSTIPGGPAARAGIRDGDFIVWWNDRRIGNVHDLMDALGCSAPGETVRLKIRRGEKSIYLSVTLGAR